MDKMLKIIERIVDSVVKQNGNQMYVKEIIGQIADFVKKDGSIETDILDVIRDILKLIGPSPNERIQDAPIHAPIQDAPIQDASRITIKQTGQYHENQRRILRDKDRDSQNKKRDTEIFSEMTKLATKIKVKVPAEDDPLKDDKLSSIRVEFAIRYIDLKRKVHRDSTKNITLQEFESTFRTFFYDLGVYSTFFDELMTGTMRLEAPNR